MAKALIIVDMQNDFCEGGALAVPGGRDLARRIAACLKDKSFNDYDHLIFTQDWHIDPGDHWSETPDFNKSWPIHCAAETFGAELHSTMESALYSIPHVRTFKGQYLDSYSGFEGKDALDRTLADVLNSQNVGEVDIIGIATDHCVKETALDAKREGFVTNVLADYIKGVSVDESRKLLTNGFREAGITVK